jgi:lipopolysaccharide exporter
VALLAAFLLPIALLPREVVLVCGGARWEAAAPLLLPLAAAAFLRGTVQALGPLLHACGRADLDARGKIFEAALFVPACYLLVAQRGMQGAALAGVLTYALAFLLRATAVASVLPGSARSLAVALLRPSLLALAAMFLGLLLIRTGLPRLLCGALAEAAFVAAAFALDGSLREEAVRLRHRFVQRRVAASRP